MLDEGVNRLPVVDVDGKPRWPRQPRRPRPGVRADGRRDPATRSRRMSCAGVMWLDPSDVEVTVERGVVTLTGEVATARRRRLVPRFTRRVPGVVESSRRTEAVAQLVQRHRGLLRRRGVHVRRDVRDLLRAQLVLERRHRALPVRDPVDDERVRRLRAVERRADRSRSRPPPRACGSPRSLRSRRRSRPPPALPTAPAARRSPASVVVPPAALSVLAADE